METATICLFVYIFFGLAAGIWWAVEELMELCKARGHLTLVNLLLVPWYAVLGAIMGPALVLFMAILLTLVKICELPVWKKPVIRCGKSKD